MPKPSLRSTSWRKVKVKTPGGKSVTHYTKRKNAKSKCAECKAELHGVARGTTDRIKKLPKTKKRPERPYGGTLCSKCSRKKFIEENAKAA